MSRPRLPRTARGVGGALSAAWLVLLLLASLTASLWEPYPVDKQDPATVAKAFLQANGLL